MNMKKLLRMICLSVLIILSIFIYAKGQANNQKKDVSDKDVPQTKKTTDKNVKKDAKPQEQTTQKEEEEKGFDIKFWISIFAALLIGLIGGGGIVAIMQYRKRIKDAELKRIAELEGEKKFKDKEQILEARTAEEIYCAALKEDLGTIDLLGSPDIESKTVNLEDAFVSLHISESWRSETRFETKEKLIDHEGERHLTPEEVMKRAFQKNRVLLIIGDPGSGKTTLLKYYAMHCLDKENQKCQKLGLPGEILPFFFPLRELEYVKNEPVPLPQNLTRWSAKHLMDVPAEQFYT